MIDLYFLTSSDLKLSHARYLCRDYNVIISKQKHYGVTYLEPRTDNREEILRQSIEDAKQRWQKNTSSPDEKFFFIEDTSVIIEALSNEKEVPGVDVKYWMQDISFDKLDNELRANGNNRNVTVRSDVILRLTKHLRLLTGDEYIRFTSIINGQITDKEYVFETNVLYPWLDNKTFNKWFIPEGYDAPISILPIDEAEKSDFRKGAFNQMLSFLEKHKIIKRRGQSSQENKLSPEIGKQSNLFAEPLLFIVSGPSCAGKTTIAKYLTDHYVYTHIEASDFMHLSYYKRHGLESSLKVRDFAEEVLKNDPGIIVRQVVDEIQKYPNAPTIITGFRSEKEIEIFKSLYQGKFIPEVIYVECPQEERFQRSKRRNRADKEPDFGKFKLMDNQQFSMGLGQIKNGYSDQIIHNDSSFGEYFYKFESHYYDFIIDYQENLHEDLKSSRKPFRLEDEIILALYLQPNKDSYLTTTEIAHVINRVFDNNQTKSKNNISRYFNQYLYPYYEYQKDGNKIKICLSQTGIGRAKWLFRNFAHI